MKILIFTNENTADTKMAELIANANLPQEETKKITTLYKHTSEDECWFYRSDCENVECANGGVADNTSLIDGWIADTTCTEEDLTKQELIDQGYLPTPEE